MEIDMTKEGYMYKLANGSPIEIWAYNRIKQLEEWIEIEATHNDTCTKNILGEVCSNCQCKFSKKD